MELRRLYSISHVLPDEHVGRCSLYVWYVVSSFLHGRKRTCTTYCEHLCRGQQLARMCLPAAVCSGLLQVNVFHSVKVFCKECLKSVSCLHSPFMFDVSSKEYL